MKTIFKLIALALLPLTGIAQDNKPAEPSGPPFAADYDYPQNYTGNIRLNYVRTIEPVVPVSTEQDLTNLRTSGGKALERTVYSDGFLRPLQVVTKKHVNVHSKDLVQYYNYDASGLITHNILPFAKNDRSNAQANKFDKKVFTNLVATYSGLGYDYENTFYDETVYEASLLARPLEQRAQGDAWAGNQHGVTTQIRTGNSSDLVKEWTIRYAAGAYPATAGLYATTDLNVTVTTDEDGLVSRQYYNMQGQLVAADNSDLRTYYVYDIYNRLRYVIPPKAVTAIGSASSVSSTISDNLCFVYQYDTRGNQVSVKKPGIGRTEMRYDLYDRVVFSQDAAQRSAGSWLFYKYDEAGRLIQQGTFSGMSEPGKVHSPDPAVVANTPVHQLHPLVNYVYNTRVYSHASYQYTFSHTDFYLHYYFDTYDFIALRSGISITPTVNQLAYDETIGSSTEGFSTARAHNTQGLLTGVNSAVSDGSAWVAKVNYYNGRGELIQTFSDDLEGRLSVSGMGYDFKGNLVKTVFQNNDATIQKFYTYDCYGRLREIRHKTGTAGIRKIANLKYDDLGRLRSKQLGNMEYPVIYDYNIRNWVTGINKKYYREAQNGLYFGEELFYEKGYDVNYLNGRLAGIRWRSKGSEEFQRTYGYLYDNQQRLVKADYYKNKGEWMKADGDFTTDNISYDENGNLLSMMHMGVDAARNPLMLDDLQYTYEAGSNKLLAVSETGNSQSASPNVHDGLGDFRDITGSSDYTYDANGNLASDANRGITFIHNTWFNLNKPLSIDFANGNSVSYVYDALGNLLRKKAAWQDMEGDVMMNKERTTDYVGDMVYESTGNPAQHVALIMHDEGRVRIVETPTATNYQYDYFLRDHLNNIRAIITESATQGLAGEPLDPSTYNPGLEDPNPNPPTLSDPVGYIATSEPGNAVWETNLFERVNETRGTRPGGISHNPEEQFSADLNAAASTMMGPGKLLKVMAGDRIQLGAEAFYYSNTDPGKPLPMDVLVGQVINAITGAAAAGGEVANVFSQAAINTSNFVMDMTNIQSEAPNDTTRPAVYLNYLLFDEGFNILPEQSGAIQMGQGSVWKGETVPQFEIDQNGYIYVFTSNQSEISVSTDNLYIYHWSGSLLEEMHYYPFGLTFEASRQGGLKSTDVRYNSQSLEQNEFTSNSGSESYGLDWYDFMARSYDVQLGRWMQPDPMMQHASPYLAMSNNPTIFTDPDGLYDGNCPDCPEQAKSLDTHKSSDGNNYLYNNGQWWKEAQVEANKPYASLAFGTLDHEDSRGDFYREPIYREEGKLKMHHEVLAQNARLNAEEARRAAVKHALMSQYRSYGWNDQQNRAMSRFMLQMAIPYGGAFRIAGGLIRIASITSKIGSIGVPIYRVYGGGASMFGKSYSLINPRYVPFYRNFAGLPSINSGEFLLKGSVRIDQLKVGRWFAAPLDGNVGGLPFELYQNYNQLINPIITKVKYPF